MYKNTGWAEQDIDEGHILRADYAAVRDDRHDKFART